MIRFKHRQAQHRNATLRAQAEVGIVNPNVERNKDIRDYKERALHIIQSNTPHVQEESSQIEPPQRGIQKEKVLSYNLRHRQTQYRNTTLRAQADVGIVNTEFRENKAKRDYNRRNQDIREDYRTEILGDSCPYSLRHRQAQHRNAILRAKLTIANDNKNNNLFIRAQKSFKEIVPEQRVINAIGETHYGKGSGTSTLSLGEKVTASGPGYEATKPIEAFVAPGHNFELKRRLVALPKGTVLCSDFYKEAG